jgi:hypothetical protein
MPEDLEGQMKKLLENMGVELPKKRLTPEVLASKMDAVLGILQQLVPGADGTPNGSGLTPKKDGGKPDEDGDGDGKKASHWWFG